MERKKFLKQSASIGTAMTFPVSLFSQPVKKEKAAIAFIIVTHDCNSPRPYSLGFRVQETNGFIEFDYHYLKCRLQKEEMPSIYPISGGGNGSKENQFLYWGITENEGSQDTFTN